VRRQGERSARAGSLHSRHTLRSRGCCLLHSRCAHAQKRRQRQTRARALEVVPRRR
jgi:hypothetical protein